jgi:hypothetical protein
VMRYDHFVLRYRDPTDRERYAPATPHVRAAGILKWWIRRFSVAVVRNRATIDIVSDEVGSNWQWLLRL